MSNYCAQMHPRPCDPLCLTGPRAELDLPLTVYQGPAPCRQGPAAALRGVGTGQGGIKGPDMVTEVQKGDPGAVGVHATSWNRGAGRGHRGRQELRVEFEGVSSASACGAEDEVIKKLVLLLTPSRCSWGTSIMVQWLGIRACNAGGLGSIPVDEAEGKMVFDFLVPKKRVCHTSNAFAMIRPCWRDQGFGPTFITGYLSGLSKASTLPECPLLPV